MERKHIYQSVNVEAVDVAALVTAMVVACFAPGTMDPGVCIVALDVAKVRFFAALSNARGEVMRILRFDHPKQTLTMLQLLAELKGKNLDVKVVLEPTGTYGDALKYQCRQRGLPVYEVSPKRTHDMAEVLDGVPSMHDAKATVVIAQLHAMGKSREWEPLSAVRRELRALLDHRVICSAPLEPHYGRLEGLMARHWPEFGEVIDVRANRSWPVMLSKYPGPEAVVRAKDEVRHALRTISKGALSAERIEQVIAAATNSLGVPMTAAEQALLSDLSGEIQRLRTKVDQIDELIVSRIAPDRTMSLMAEVVGPAATAALVAYVGMPSEYASASSYEKACGLNLKERSSGKHKGQLRITKRGSPRVRQLLYLAALRCCQSDPIIRAWYERRDAYKADAKKKAVVAVVRKLVRALWCMGHDVEHPKAFDSRLLFDVSRLQITTEQQPSAPTQLSRSPVQTSKRTGRTTQSGKPSEVEVHP